MVKRVKKLARKVLHGKVLQSIEDEYRLARASYANARFGWPARGMRVIMITGTNGKTTTAHFLFSILRAAGYSVGMISTAEFKINDRSQMNETNMTAIEPVLLRRKLAELKAAQVEYVILEATSQALDQYRLWGIPCEVAIMTNLTQDHLDYHKTMENYAAAKSKLWNLKPNVSVLNMDDEWFDYFKKKATGTILTYGKDEGTLHFSGYKVDQAKAHFTLKMSSGKLMITLHLAGLYNVYNALAAATAAHGLGVSDEIIEEGIEALHTIPGRLEQVSVKAPYTVVVDYAHTPDGLEKLLVAARSLSKGNIWLVFGACGDRDKAKRPLMGTIAAKRADRIILTDEESYSEDPLQIIEEIKQGIASVKGAKEKLMIEPDRKRAIKHALDNAQKGDLILVTGLGHESFRIQNGKKTPWNDADVIKKLLKT